MMQWPALSRRSGVSGPAGVEQEFHSGPAGVEQACALAAQSRRSGVSGPAASEKGNESHERYN